MFAIMFFFGDSWHTLPPRYPSRYAAHEAAVAWRAANKIPTAQSDAFLRVTPVAE